PARAHRTRPPPNVILRKGILRSRRTPKRRIYAFQSTLSFRIRFSGANMRALHLVIPNPLQRCQYTRLCTLSFRIRFSGEESAFHFRLIVSRRVSRHSCDTCASRSDRTRFVSTYAFPPPATSAPFHLTPTAR